MGVTVIFNGGGINHMSDRYLSPDYLSQFYYAGEPPPWISHLAVSRSYNRWMAAIVSNKVYSLPLGCCAAATKLQDLAVLSLAGDAPAHVAVTRSNDDPAISIFIHIDEEDALNCRSWHSANGAFTTTILLSTPILQIQSR